MLSKTSKTRLNAPRRSCAQQLEGGVLFPAFGAFLREVFCLKFSPAFLALELHYLATCDI